MTSEARIRAGSAHRDRRAAGGGGAVLDVAIERLDVSVYTVPTDVAESDGTAEWHETTMVVVEAHAGDHVGLGYTYGDGAAGVFARDTLAPLAVGRDPFAVTRVWTDLVRSSRNVGRPGIASTAIAAIDTSLWDLKARLLELPLATLLGAVRDMVPVYGSGGFTSYPDAMLAGQLASWVELGIPRVKMKIGRRPDHDLHRVDVARSAIGDDAELYVDANGALERKQALALAEELAVRANVSWFEEPVTSDDLDGLRLLRDRGPAGMDVAAGEYGYTLSYFEQMLAAGAVDCLQADVTRCEGITGFLRVAALCEARSLPLSAHCAPAIHLHPCLAAGPLRHLEFFHDHVRVERILLDGVREPIDGELRPDLSRPGNGLSLKRPDAERFAL